MDSKKMIAGLLAGAAIGVAIGILLAPTSGAETRKKLMKGTGDLTDSLQQTIDESMVALKGKFNSGVDEVVKKGREMINHGSDGVKI